MTALALGAARRHRQGDGRFRRQLRRQGARAGRPADARAEPADQRLGRHRGRHGHEHPAAQPRRGGHRLHRADRRSEHHDRRPDAVHPGPGLPDRRHHQRRAGDRARLSRPAAAASYVRARTEIEEDDKGRQAIIITELPYQVNKARLLERIAELVREKVIEGIAAMACATSPTRTACASSSSSSAARSPTSC